MKNVTMAEVIEAIRELCRAGHLTAKGAQSLESACWLIARMAPETSSPAFVSEHLDELLTRYAAEHELSERTRHDYRSRVRTAIRYYEQRTMDPSWKPRRRVVDSHDLDLLRQSTVAEPRREGASPRATSSEGQLVLPKSVGDAIRRGLPVTTTISGRTVRIVPAEPTREEDLYGSLQSYAKGKAPRDVLERVIKEVALAAAREGRHR